MRTMRVSSDSTPPAPTHKFAPLIPHAPIRTQREVAALLGITHDRVRHIEEIALKKLRRALKEQGYHHEADLS